MIHHMSGNLKHKFLFSENNMLSMLMIAAFSASYALFYMQRKTTTGIHQLTEYKHFPTDKDIHPLIQKERVT